MITALTLQDQRNHQAVLWRNIRRAEREQCIEHAENLLAIYSHILKIKLPRTIKPKTNEENTIIALHSNVD